MAVRKLLLDDFVDEINYALIGIHCTLEDYRLAYLLNKHLKINLKRHKEDLDFENGTSYSFFEWEDTAQLTTWSLVSNVSKIEIDTIANEISLFEDQEKVTKIVHLIPENRNVNYFLKINDDIHKSNKSIRISNNIQKIPQIITAYNIDANLLKSKDNLIFY